MKTIELKQLPVINHQLSVVGLAVKERIESLNLSNQVATEETIKTLKELRATLNIELNEFEAQRKDVSRKINEPYKEFESVYKIEIAEKYTRAINTLGDAIGKYETQVKNAKKEIVKAFFAELCKSENIDFLTFEMTKIEINLTITEKKYKETCIEFVNKVKDDLALIATNEHEAEILVEYKKSLNASNAIVTVNNRKSQEKAEQERIKAAETQRRINRLTTLGLKYNETFGSYELDEKNYITNLDIKQLSNDDFNARLIQFEEAKKASQPQVLKAPEVINSKPVEKQPEQSKPVGKPLQAVFKVTGTREQIYSVRDFMIANGIKYENV